MFAASPRQVISFVQLASAVILAIESVTGEGLPHRQCVKTATGTSNRISCKPSSGRDLLNMEWDYLRMECNTTGTDGKAAKFSLFFSDMLSEVPTPSPVASHRKWLGVQKAFMDVPACGLYVYYVAKVDDPRLCAWHCYQVRQGQPDKELCIADATQDCVSAVSDHTTNGISSSLSHYVNNGTTMPPATSSNSGMAQLRRTTSANGLGLGMQSTLNTSSVNAVSNQSTNGISSSLSHNGTTMPPATSSNSGNRDSDSNESESGIIAALIVITVGVSTLLVFFTIREVRKRQFLQLNGPVSKGVEDKQSIPLSLSKQQPAEDETESKQKLKKKLEDGWEGNPDLRSEDSKSATSSDGRKDNEYTVPEKVTDLSTSVHFTTPITVEEGADIKSPMTVDEPTSVAAPDLPAPSILERSNSAENSAVNNASSLLMSKYVLQYGKGFSRVGSLVPDKYSGMLGKGEAMTDVGPRVSTLSEDDDGRCIVYPHKIHTTQQPN